MQAFEHLCNLTKYLVTSPNVSLGSPANPVHRSESESDACKAPSGFPVSSKQPRTLSGITHATTKAKSEDLLV